MGIIEDFLKTKTEAPAATSSQGSGIVEQFLKGPVEAPASNRTIPNVPISDSDKTVTYSTPEEAAAREYKGPASSREFPNPAAIVGNKALGGIKTMGEGVGDVFSNKPASGFGKVGSGVMETAFSVPSGVSEFIDKLIGKSEGVASFGDRVGLVVGGAAPVKGAKAATRAVTGAASNDKAFNKLVEDIGPENAGWVAKEMRSNPNLTPADLSPRVKIGAQKLFAGVEGPHVNYLGNTTEQRLASAAKDLETHMNANLGKVVDPVKKLEELKANIREVGKDQINPAVAGSKPVDLTKTIKELDEILKPGVNSIITHDTHIADPNLEKSLSGLRKYLTDDASLRSDPEQLNRLQSAFRKKADMVERSDPYLASAIRKVRDNIVNAIDDASGGKYKPALEKYRDEYHISDAFAHGHDTIIKNGKAISDRPEFFEKWVKDATKPELEAAKEGARLAYDTQMNAFKHAARRGTDIGDVEFNKRRMTALFGKEDADKMFKVFEDAKKVADTNNKLVQGSQTQMRNVQDSYFKPHDPAKAADPMSTAVNVGLPIAGEVAGQFMAGSMGGGVLTGAALLAAKGAGAGISKAKNYAIKKGEDSRNLNYSEMALPVAGPSRDKLIERLEAVANAPVKPSIMNKVKLALPVLRAP